MSAAIVDDPELFDRTPEFAMGIHIGWEARSQRPSRLSSERVYVVFNGSIAILVDDILSGQLSNFVLANIDHRRDEEFYEKARDGSDMSPQEPERRSISPCEDVEVVARALNLSPWQASRLHRREHIHGSPPFTGQTRNGQKFVRFSSYLQDRRITPLGGLLAGSCQELTQRQLWMRVMFPPLSRRSADTRCPPQIPPDFNSILYRRL